LPKLRATARSVHGVKQTYSRIRSSLGGSILIFSPQDTENQVHSYTTEERTACSRKASWGMAKGSFSSKAFSTAFSSKAFSTATSEAGVIGGEQKIPRLWHAFALAGAILALFISQSVLGKGRASPEFCVRHPLHLRRRHQQRHLRHEQQSFRQHRRQVAQRHWRAKRLLEGRAF
jgi:hypothetical protein